MSEVEFRRSEITITPRPRRAVDNVKKITAEKMTLKGNPANALFETGCASETRFSKIIENPKIEIC